jgi:hypothetical protein
LISRAPRILFFSKWILIGGLGLTALALVLMAVALSLPVNQCAGQGPGNWPCTKQDEQNYRIQVLLGQIAVPLIWLAPTLSILAFIAWINVRRW